MNKFFIFPIVLFLLSFAASNLNANSQLEEPPFVPNDVLSIVLKHRYVKSFFHSQTIELSDIFLDVGNIKIETLQAFKILSSGSSEGENAFQFTLVDWRDPSKILVRFKYPPEGMYGEAQLKYENSKWTLVNIDVWES